MTTRVGIVGAGFIGRRHARSLAAHDDVLITAVADPIAERREGLADEVGARAYPSWSELLGSEQLDALYVCVPPYGHGALEDAAIDRRLPFFVEKPLAADLATAERVARRVADARLLTAVGYHWRYLDTVQRARQLLADAPARLVSGAWLDKAPRVDWWSRQERSGGQTVEQATHLFDLARVLVGEVTSGSAIGTRAADGPGDILHACTAALRFASGAVGSFTNSCLLPGGFRIELEVIGAGLGLRLTEYGMVVATRDGEQAVERRVDPFALEDAAFVAAVRGEGDDIRCSYAEALRTHRLVTAVAAAAQGDGLVTLPEPS